MSFRPPDFNRVFAADARHDFTSFTEACVVTVRIAKAADLRLPTGRLEPGRTHSFGGHCSAPEGAGRARRLLGNGAAAGPGRG